MKQLSTLAFAAFALAASAQPTIQYSAWPTTAAPLTAYTITNASSLTPPSNGSGQMWDYTAATFALLCAATVEPAAGTPYAATYPAANWSLTETVSGISSYNYFRLSATGLENVATNVPLNPNAYTNYEKVLQFPLSFGGSFTDTYASPQHTGTETWTYGGAGTLITSLGTYTNQVKMTSTGGDIVLWNASPLTVRLIINSNGITFFGPSTVGIAEQATADPSVAVYPVPASDKLNVTGINGPALWTVSDMLGRTLLRGNGISNGSLPIDISSLTEGGYIITLTSDRRTLSARFLKN